MFRKIREWISVQLSKNPGRMVLYTILVFNIVFLLLSALVISRLSLSGTEEMGFFEAAFCTITMILDAGCIQFVISDIGSSGVALVVVCLVIIFIGMISFTGAIIGYITSYIIVNSYCVNNVVISNRYISKMITQVGEKDALFDFFSDILTYDDGDSDEYQSNELYIKRADSFFTALPEECTAAQLIRSVYETSLAESRSSGDICPTIVLGYVKPGGTMVIFNGNQTKTRVKLAQGDKLIVFSAH